MSAEFYNTILESSEGSYKEKGSKFIAFAFPVKSTEEIKKHISECRKQFYDARHVCYAWMLGAERVDFRSNDDGEPSGTAGKPILGQINSRVLTDVLVVVVRYFGGVLLGTSGLITAYKAAASDALDNAQKVRKTVNSELKLTFEYPLLTSVMKILKSSESDILHQDFQLNCELHISIPLHEKNTIKRQLEKIDGVTVI